MGDIIIIGDLNAWTGNLIDFVNDNVDNTLLDNVFCEENDDIIVSDDLLANNMLIHRNSEDKSNNEYGKRLIELC